MSETPLSPGYQPPDRRTLVPKGKWHPAAVMLAGGASNITVCTTLNISPSVLARWRRMTAFKNYINRVHDDSIERAIGKLTTVMDKAADVIIGLLDSETEKTRLEAVDRVERWVKIFRNDKQILEKLTALEQRMPGVLTPLQQD